MRSFFSVASAVLLNGFSSLATLTPKALRLLALRRILVIHAFYLPFCAFCLLLSVFCLPLSAVANSHQTAFHEQFGKLPILHEGRMKPLSSFAGIMLRHLHGKPTFNSLNATQWLATLTLSPEATVDAPLFHIKDKRLLQTLNLEASASKYYSLLQLYPALQARSGMIDAIGQKDRNSLTKREAGLLSLTDKVSTFLQLSEAFSLIRAIEPQPGEALLSHLGISPKSSSLTYLSLFSSRPEIDAHLKHVITKKGEEITRYSPLEKELAGSSFQLAAIDGAAQNNDLLRLIPTEGEEWVTPWQLVREGKGNPENILLLGHWEQLIRDYSAEDYLSALENLNTIHEAVAPHVVETADTLELEALYHALPWKPLAIAAYLLTALLCVFHKRIPQFHKVACGIAALGFISHSAGITLRMLILERPPVSTLYESVLFVAWVSVLTGLLFFWRSRQRESLLVGALLGAGLLLISPIYVEGDSLEMLVAVLNTNIWLATHVVIITMGYSASVMAGSMAHLQLWRLGTSFRDLDVKPRDDTLAKPIFLILLTAAALTTIGTILGGIWADQSWGRFWGWDPKENGALFIVLWIVWLLHARITKQLSERWWYGLLGGLNIVVALSWFGVNLLGVGLHSYGFTEAATYGLAAFCAGEIFVIGLLMRRMRHS